MPVVVHEGSGVHPAIDRLRLESTESQIWRAAEVDCKTGTVDVQLQIPIMSICSAVASSAVE